MPKMDRYLESQMPKCRNEKQAGNVGEEQYLTYDLKWIDDFVQKIRPYIYVRELDHLLILVPNQAYKLNDSGLRILKSLLRGQKTLELLRQIGNDEAKRRDIHNFFCDLRAVVSGCLREQEERRAIDYYEFNGEFNEYPVLSEIAVTYRCNLHCDFCYVGDREYGELNTKDMKRVIHKIFHEAEIPSVSFTGGEPMVRADIEELISWAARAGLWTNLITNGTLLDHDRVHALKHAGLCSAQVSIEGPDALTHERITRVKGSFEATLRGIELLQQAEIPVHTNTTISRNNIDVVHEIVPLIKGLGLTRLSMNLLIPCGAARHKKELWVSYSEIGSRILEMKHRAADEGVRFLWYSPVPMCRFNPIAYGLGNKSCAAITGLLSIDPLGNIIPCSSWREPVGSLFHREFSEIWRSKKTQFYKRMEYAPEECKECDQFDMCKGACPLYWQACGKKELGARA